MVKFYGNPMIGWWFCQDNNGRANHEKAIICGVQADGERKFVWAKRKDKSSHSSPEASITWTKKDFTFGEHKEVLWPCVSGKELIYSEQA